MSGITVPWDATPEQLAFIEALATQYRASLSTAEKEREGLLVERTAVLHTIRGTVEGYPTGAHNYLQRLRELMAVERERLHWKCSLCECTGPKTLEAINEHLLACKKRPPEDAARAANKASDSSALEKALGALRELLRLYDWRFELAKRENDERHFDSGSDFWFETRRMLRQYGAEKKAAWAAARALLSGGAHVAVPKAQKEEEK